MHMGAGTANAKTTASMSIAEPSLLSMGLGQAEERREGPSDLEAGDFSRYLCFLIQLFTLSYFIHVSIHVSIHVFI